MKDYTCERLYRDARITSIYEGTTQLQTVAAIRYVTTGAYLAQIRTYEAAACAPGLESLKVRLKEMADKFEAATARVNELKDQEFQDFVARRLVEMAAFTIMGHLLVQEATTAPELFTRSANVYVRYSEAEIGKHADFIAKFRPEDLESYRKQ